MAFFNVSVRTDARVAVKRSWVYELEAGSAAEAAYAARQHAAQWWGVKPERIQIIDCYEGTRAYPVPAI